MATISNIAQRLLDENNIDSTRIHATASTAKTRVEYLIDNAIDYVNLEVGTSIADLSGSDGEKSITGSESEIFTVKALSALCLRTYLDKGPNVNISPVGIAQTLTDPHYQVYAKLFWKSVNRMRGRSFVRT